MLTLTNFGSDLGQRREALPQSQDKVCGERPSMELASLWGGGGGVPVRVYKKEKKKKKKKASCAKNI